MKALGQGCHIRMPYYVQSHGDGVRGVTRPAEGGTLPALYEGEAAPRCETGGGLAVHLGWLAGGCQMLAVRVG